MKFFVVFVGQILKVIFEFGVYRFIANS
jgi:hypothetical protein